MYIDLTTNVSQDSPMMKWAKSQENPYIAMGHIGTHLDTYEKSNIPIEYFQSKAIIFDVRDVQEVSENDIDINKIQKDDFVIFRTGSLEKYGFGSDLYFENHPQLSENLIKILIEKKIRFIGVDCPGIRQGEEHEKADRFCEKNGVYVIENINNLSKIISERFKLYTMWLDDEVMTGLKCRLIADCNN